MAYGLLLLRVVAGGTIFAHGAQKLFGWFGGGGVRGTAGFFENMGFRPPILLTVLAGLGETGGLLFAAGFLTPLAALGMTIVMLNAIAVVHWSKGFFTSNGGLEFPLLIATTAVAVAAIGPGRGRETRSGRSAPNEGAGDAGGGGAGGENRGSPPRTHRGAQI